MSEIKSQLLIINNIFIDIDITSTCEIEYLKQFLSNISFSTLEKCQSCVNEHVLYTMQNLPCIQIENVTVAST